MGSSTRKLTPRAGAGWTTAFGLGILTVALILSLGSYNPEDPSLNTFSTAWRAPTNVLGYAGSWASDALLQLFGYGAWLVPALVFVALARWLIQPDRFRPILGTRWGIATGVLLAATGLLCDLLPLKTGTASYAPQGLLGIAVGAASKPLVGKAGSYLTVLFLFWTFCMVWWETLPARIVTVGSRVVRALVKWAQKAFGDSFVGFRLPLWPAAPAKEAAKPKDESPKQEISPRKIQLKAAAEEEKDFDEEDDEESEDEAPAPVIRAAEIVKEPARPKPPKTATPPHPTEWQLPPLSLLELSKKKVKPLTDDQLRETARKITSALRSFEIDGEVVEISPGPIITMYEFQPAPGVRVSKLQSAQTDLAMTLGVSSVRIVAPIPGKSVAGIEVPNPDKEDIVLRDVYEQTVEKAKGIKLPLVIGKDGEGKPICEDLSRMPHLLIGGATSMGKSVLVNSILTGLLCRFTPEEFRLIIVDPKLVEFKAFEDIPHLLLPIVNDPSDASQALKWAVSETRRRYLLMQKLGAKNLESYNAKATDFDVSKLKDGEEPPAKMPYIVIIIDELAELMLTGKKDVEQSIVRLSQLARAAGLHLIMATQRPSADIVTGLIKSNCPARASLRVASASDSRIILDCAGAEQLLGRGDMFFTNSGPMGMRRMQSAYVSDGEIDKICDFWRGQGEPEYREEILNPESGDEGGSNTELDAADRDPLYKDVLDFAKEKRVISTSLIQRRFQIGYTRAARIMEQLESAGAVGEQSAAGKPRDVIV